MPNTLGALIERRAQTWTQMQEIQSRAHPETGLSAEDSEAWDRGETELTQLRRSIEQLQRGAVLEAEFSRMESPPPSTAVAVDDGDDRAAKYRDAYRSYLRRGMLGLSEDERQLLATGFVQADELRAQGIATSAAGGYLVPPEFEVRLVETLKAFGGMIENATVIQTDNGTDISWPTVDTTGQLGAILAENTAVTELDVTFGTTLLSAYMYTSLLTRVSYQLAQDSAFDVEDFLQRIHGIRIARILNQHFTTGTGTAQPQGIVPGGTAVVASQAGFAVVLYDDLITLMHAIDPAYRTQDAVWMVNDAFLQRVRKIKDTTGVPIWQPGLQLGAPDLLLGHRYVINQDLAAPALNAKSALFGDIRSAYVVRRVTGFGQLVLRERYAELLQNGYMTFGRFGGRVQDANAYRVFQFAAA